MNPTPQLPPATVAATVRRVLEPLNEETAELLKPVSLHRYDRLRVEMSEDGRDFVIHPYARRDEGAPFEASFHARFTWIQNVPQREDLKNNRFALAATDITALIINANWSDDRLDMDDEARTTYDFLVARFLSQTIQSQRRAAYKLKRVMPPVPADWVDHPAKPLAPYQVVGCVTTIGQEGSALLAEQGTGKTPIVIRRVCVEAHRLAMSAPRPKQLYRVLIACPKNVRYNWQHEFNEFSTIPGKVTVLRGGQLDRMSQLIETISVEKDDDSEFAAVVCSYETIRRSWDELRMVHWHLVVADESHMMKESRTERAKTMLQLRNISDARMILTGTSICNTLVDLYSQLEFLGEGMSGFTGRAAFKNFYCTTRREEGQHEDKIIGYVNVPFLQERLARIAFMITKKEALPDLPDKVYDICTVEMTPTQRERYIQLQDQLALEIEGGGEDGKQMLAQHILTKLLRLAQITSGFYSWDPKLDPESGDVIDARVIEYANPNPRLEQFIEDVRALGDDEKAIVWACFKPNIRQISERLTLEGIPHGCYTGDTSDADRAALENAFNRTHARDMKVFVGNAAAGGTGLNLRGYDPDATGDADHGCDCTFVGYYSQGWSMVHRNQSEDRAHRRGTRRNVRYRDYVCAGTIDEEIRVRVMNKTLTALTLQDVREIMRRVLEGVPDDE